MKHAPLAAAVLLAIPALAQNGESEDLQAINVKSSGDDTRTEDTRSYTTAAMRTTTGLALAPQETPQSVSVVTKTQLDERGITTMHDALKPPPVSTSSPIPDAGATSRAASTWTKSKKTASPAPCRVLRATLTTIRRA